MIYKVLITGGVCAGKSTCLDFLSQEFRSMGYEVFIINEQATQMVNNGLTHQVLDSYDESGFTGFNWQLTQTLGQYEAERRLISTIKRLKTDRDFIILCDRGILDGKSFESELVWALVDEEMFSVYNIDVNEYAKTYDSIIHLETVAKGKPEFYTLENNKARRENIEQAVENDNKLIKVYDQYEHFHIIGNDGSFSEKLIMARDCISKDLKEHTLERKKQAEPKGLF